MKLVEVGELLKTIIPNVHHYAAFEESENYIVWAEDGQSNSGYEDNQMQLQVIQGTIDYYTRTEFDPVIDLIQQKLNSSDMAWKLNSTQYEEETEYIHHEWIFEIDNKIGGS